MDVDIALVAVRYIESIRHVQVGSKVVPWHRPLYSDPRKRLVARRMYAGLYIVSLHI